MNNFKGILLMLIAMAGFTMEDLFMKKLSVNLSTGQILITLGIGSSLVFAIMAKIKGYNLTSKVFWTKGMVIRQFAEGIAAVAFITALTLIPLSTVAAVFQATPLVLPHRHSLPRELANRLRVHGKKSDVTKITDITIGNSNR